MRFLLFMLFLFAAASPAIGEPAREVESPAPRVVAAGTELHGPRLGLILRVPRKSVVRKIPRGNQLSVEAESVQAGLYLIYHTSYRIRRIDGLERSLQNALGDVFGGCEWPQFPARADSFDVIASCEGEIGLNQISRRIRLIRAGEWLHLLHVAVRLESMDLAREILAGARLNPGFAPR